MNFCLNFLWNKYCTILNVVIENSETEQLCIFISVFHFLHEMVGLEVLENV